MTEPARQLHARWRRGPRPIGRSSVRISCAFAAALSDRVLAHLKLLDGDYGGFPIDRLAALACRPRPAPIGPAKASPMS